MILAEAGAAAPTATASVAAAVSKRRRIVRLNTTMRREMRSLQLLDVDGLGALVPVLLFERDLGALAQRAIAVPGDPGEMDEEIAPSAVGRDEAEALLVREPLDRSGAHRYPTCCPTPQSGAVLF